MPAKSKSPIGQPQGPGPPAPRQVTVALSVHRPETLPAAARLMDRHDVICLEEPPTPGFSAMLAGDLSVGAYLPETGTEYPLFTEQSCRLLRARHRRGKTIVQVEPYLETLLDIQLRLADGMTPGAAAAGSRRFRVYDAERAATGALLDFYQTAAGGDLDATTAAVLRFAAADAYRFRLRDRMRAAALKKRIRTDSRVYVEAGVMHLSLIRRLAAARGAGQRLSAVHLQAEESRRLSGRPLVLAPGDLLTMRRIFRHRHEPARDTLLAARSLIYNRIVATGEMAGAPGGHPHLVDEHACIDLVSVLDMRACRALYPHVRRLPTPQAREMVAAFVKRWIPGSSKTRPAITGTAAAAPTAGTAQTTWSGSGFSAKRPSSDADPF